MLKTPIGIPMIGLCVFQLVHSMSLPLVVTFDGHLYHELAKWFAENGDISQWRDFVRTPMFPFLLHTAFMWFGEGSNSVILVNCMVYSVATLLLFNSACPGSAGRWIAAVLAIFSPLAVTYQHMLLSECFLALAVAAVAISTVRYKPTALRSAALITSLTAAYYIKPSFLYISIALAIACFVSIISRRILRHPPEYFRNFDGAFLLCALISLLLTVPWQIKLSQSNRMGAVKAYACLKNLTVTPTYFVNQDASDKYRRLIELYGSRLTWSGVPNDALIYPILELMTDNERQRILLHSYSNNTLYTMQRAITASLAYFCDTDSENYGFATAVLSHQSDNLSKIYGGPEHLKEEVARTYQRHATDSLFARFVSSLIPLFHILHVVSIPLVVIICAILGRRAVSNETAVLILIVAIYIGVHAIGLLSINRYAFPVYGLVYFILFSVICSAWRVFTNSHPCTQSDHELPTIVHGKA